MEIRNKINLEKNLVWEFKKKSRLQIIELIWKRILNWGFKLEIWNIYIYIYIYIYKLRISERKAYQIF